MSGNVSSEKRKPCKVAVFTPARKQSVRVPAWCDCLVVRGRQHTAGTHTGARVRRAL